MDTILLPADRLLDPVRLTRRIGTAFGGDHVPRASDVNALDEVVNSTWFTNRIGLFSMTPEEVAQGPGSGTGPDRSGPWTVISAKTEGVTPGFNIRDARGNVYVIKFDPPGHLGMTTCAGQVCTKIFHAAGYNVPDDVTVTFRREDIVLGEGVRLKLEDGTRRPMTEADLEEILGAVDRLPSGEWFAISSRFLTGRPIGPFDYRGTRSDDPNDRIAHEHRRSLRGLEVFASWLIHFDTKQHNSLDMFVEEDGRTFVKHYLIDFASTLGAGAKGPQPRYGYEYTIDLPAIGGRLLALGLHESTWRTRDRDPSMTAVGYLDVEPYDPIEFKPLQPNSAFANRTGPDGYWAAKIITAFRDEHIDAIVSGAGYPTAREAAYVSEMLAARRDRIGRHFFDELPPLEYFRIEGGTLVFRDLGTERDLYRPEAARYRLRARPVDRRRKGGDWGDWVETDLPSVPLARLTEPDDATNLSFLAVEAQVLREAGWSGVVTAYLSRDTGRTVAMER